MGNLQPGSIAGEIRGKVGGLIFSRNASGSYVKAYAKPVNPNTVPQNLARGHFASAVASWNSLENWQQSIWKDFADANSSFDSGVNAFVSCNAVVNNCIANKNTIFTITPIGNETFINFSSVLEPPPGPFVAPFIVNLAGVQVWNTNGVIDSTVSLNITQVGDGTTGPEQYNFTPSAILVQMSAPSGKKGKFVKQDIITLGNTDIITEYSKITDPALTLEVNPGKNLELARNIPQVGQFVTVNVYWVSKYGQKFFISGQETEVEAV